MAPEVAKGKYGKEVDIYAMGVMLYEMLTGRVPFDGESTGEILMKHLSEPPDLSVLPPRVRPVVGKALEKDPARRYRSVAEFAAAFEQAVIGRPAVLEIPEESFRIPAPALAQHHAGAKPGGPASLGRSGPGARPNNQMWWWVAGVIVLVGLITGSLAPVVPVVALGALAYGAYASVKWLGGGKSCALRGAVSQAFVKGTDPPVVAPRPAPAVPLTPRRPAEPRAAARFTPNTPRRLPLADRVMHFTGTAALCAVLTALFTAGVAFVAPDFFSNLDGLAKLDEAAIGLFAATAVLGAWSVTAVAKLMEGRKLENGTRRLLMLATGCAVGLAAWGIDEALMVRLGAPTDAAFVSIGSRPLVAGEESTWLAYTVFFGLLFGLRRWWWQVDTFRPARMRVTSVLVTVMLAWLLSVVWAFPHTWAVLWAAVISSVVQLSSVWTPPESRRI
jgi:hypothetical protein